MYQWLLLLGKGVPSSGGHVATCHADKSDTHQKKERKMGTSHGDRLVQWTGVVGRKPRALVVGNVHWRRGGVAKLGNGKPIMTAL